MKHPTRTQAIAANAWTAAAAAMSRSDCVPRKSVPFSPTVWGMPVAVDTAMVSIGITVS